MDNNFDELKNDIYQAFMELEIIKKKYDFSQGKTNFFIFQDTDGLYYTGKGDIIS